MARMTDEELLQAIAAEENDSYGGQLTNNAALSVERQDALDRYNARLYGNEQTGRSQVVSSDVRDAVEGLMPSLARVFLSGDELGKFEPMGPEDQSADIESQVCNHFIFTKNDGYVHVYSAIKDALLLANGYVKVWWETNEEVLEENYEGQGEDQLTMLANDPDVEIVEQEEYEMDLPMPTPQGMVAVKVPCFNVKVKRTKRDEYVRIACVPPDEIRVTARHTEVSLMDCDFVQHTRRITVGQLREMGYVVDDDIAGEDENINQGVERSARSRYNEVPLYQEDSAHADVTRKIVTLKETWYRGDVSGTGKPELWFIPVVGDQILRLKSGKSGKQPADMIPIATFVPSVYPHSHIGVSYYSMISDVALIKTTLWRQYLDNTYLVNNSEKVLNEDAVEGNLDDWLISRPGGIKFVKGPVNEAFAQLVTPDVGSSLLQALEYVENVKENRTGIGRINQGNLDPNIMNRTASGAAMMMSAGQARQEMICRNLAGGVRDLFLLVHATALKHSTKALQIRLQNQWQSVNPREWVRRSDFRLSVGLGTGAPEQQMAKLQALAPMVMQAAQVGMAGPEQLYNLGAELFKAAGFRSVDKFLIQPQPGAQMPPSPPPPEVLAEQEKGKVTVAVAQMTAQQEGQHAAAKVKADAAIEQARMQADIAIQNNKRQSDYELELAKAKMQVEMDAIKHSREQDTAIRKAEIQAAAQIEVARVNAGISDGSALEAANAQAAGLVLQTLQPALQQLQQAAQTIAQSAVAPKRIVRDPRTQRAVGVVPDHTVQ